MATVCEKFLLWPSCLCIYLEAVKFHFRFISFRFITLVSLMIFFSFLRWLLFVLGLHPLILVSFEFGITCAFWLLAPASPFPSAFSAALELIESLTFTCTYRGVKGRRVPRPLVMPNVRAINDTPTVERFNSFGLRHRLQSSVFSPLSSVAFVIVLVSLFVFISFPSSSNCR